MEWSVEVEVEVEVCDVGTYLDRAGGRNSCRKSVKARGNCMG